MSKSTKSVKCVRDLRDIPLKAYRLPSDGRQWKKAAVVRQRLANFLATFADGDGTRVYPGEKKMTAFLGCHRATTFRALDDLRTLGLMKDKLGLVDRSGRPSERGTALRVMDVDGFRARAGVASSKPEVASSQPEVASSIAGVASTCDTTVQALDRHRTEPPTPPGWEEGWFLSDHIFNQMGAVTTKVRPRLKAESDRHGFEVMKTAVRLFLKFKGGTDGMKDPWLVFLSGADPWMEKARQEVERDPERNPVLRAKQEQMNAAQSAKDRAFLEAEPASDCGEMDADAIFGK